VLTAACGSYHTAIVDEEGWLWVCGGALYGKLGLGRDVSALVATPVPLLSGPRAVRVVAVGCGSRHTLVLSAGGDLFSMGSSERGVLGLSRAAIAAGAVAGGEEGAGAAPTVCAPARLSPFGEGGVASLAVCGAHNLAVDGRGSVWSWGEGRFGRLGHGDEEDVWAPQRVAPHTLGDDGFGAGARVAAVAAGGFHSVAVTADGVAYAWGGGEHGQLGLGAVANIFSPSRVTALEHHVLRSAGAGWSHTLFLTDRGSVFCCGNVDHQKLGLTREESEAGLAASAALQQGAAVGQAPRPGRCICVPRIVGGLASLRVTRVAAYNEHSIALSEHCGPSLVGWRDEPLALGTLPLFMPPLELDGGAAPESGSGSGGGGGGGGGGSGSRRASLSTLTHQQMASQRTGLDSEAAGEGDSVSWEELFAEGGSSAAASASVSRPPTPPAAAVAAAAPPSLPATAPPSPPLLGYGPHFSTPLALLRRGDPAPLLPAPPSGLLPRTAPGAELVAALGRLVCNDFAADVDVVVHDAAVEGCVAGEGAKGRREHGQGAAEEAGGGGGGGPAAPAAPTPTILPAHRAILASRCDAFAALLSHAKEPRATINLHARAGTVRVLLFFLYTDCLPASLTTRDALEVAVLADYLRVVRLIGLCDRLLAHALQDAAPHTAALATALLLHADSLGWWDSPLRGRLVAAVATHFEAAAKSADFAALVSAPLFYTPPCPFLAPHPPPLVSAGKGHTLRSRAVA
jgi:RCC1 and BTB domain-containing protein